MRIPERLVAFLDGGLWAHGGTRDRENVPTSHQVFGAKVSGDREHITVFIPHQWTEGLRENLADNGRFAVTLGLSSSHETYQLKGPCTEVREAGPADFAVQGAWLDAVIDDFRKIGEPEEKLRGLRMMKIRPCLAITLRVEDLFTQTPGPGAGERVSS
jgi:hypothetical protein